MMGTDCPFPFFPDASRMDEHHRRVFRIHVLPGRREEKIHSSLRRELRIIVEGARVAVEIFARTELQRIDKDAHDHDISYALRFVDQSEMTFVQRSHRGDESNALSFCPEIGN